MARTPNRPADDEDDEDERPRPKKRPVDDEDDDRPLPKKRPAARDEDDDDDAPPPKKKATRRDDDDADDDDRPVKKKKGNGILYAVLGCGGLLLVGAALIVGGCFYLAKRTGDKLSQMTFPSPETGAGTQASKPGAKTTPGLELKGHGGAVNALAFSRDGSTLASASQDKSVKLWNADTGTEKKSIPMTNGFAFGVVWTAEGNLVTTSGNGKDGGLLSWWDPTTGVNRKKLTMTKGMVRGLAVSPDGEKLCYSKGPELEVIGSGAEDTKPPIANFKTAVYDTKYIGFAPDGNSLAFYSGFGPQLLTLSGTPKVKKLENDPQDGTGIALGADGTVFVSSTRSVVFAIDSQTATLAGNIPFDTDNFGVVLSPDGSKLAVGVANAVRLYDPKTRQELGRFTADTPETLVFNSIAFSPDGTKVAAGGGTGRANNKAKNNTVYIWKVSDMAKP